MELVIMAAGMGSRFGGLKQVEPMDDNGNFIIDYSIYDAIRCGFDKIVFIIKKENLELFRDTVGKRIENKIKVEYVFQELTNLPEGFSVPEGREKPWGTAHAILCAKDAVKDDFVIINADDFYGYDAFKTASNFIKHKHSFFNKLFTKLFKKPELFALIGYKAQNTLSENGATKRGVVTAKAGLLETIEESSVEKKDGKIFATPLDTTNTKEIEPNSLVSMNMWCLTPTLFKYLEKRFPIFLKENLETNPMKCEMYIPTEIGRMADEKLATIKVENTNAVWYGVTYKEDKPQVVAALKSLAEKGEYPQNLWQE